VPVRPFTASVSELRGALHRRTRRVRTELWGILQTTVAAGAAWGLASLLHPHPYFAPAAAVISLGVSRGGRTVRAIELTVGVAVGIAVADVIVRALGTNTLVLMLVVALSMATALLVGVGQILINQAAISGILVVATLQPGASPSPSRFLDALIGGAVALLVGLVLFPRDPVRAMAQAARPVVSDLAVALRATAEALRDGDEARARRAMEMARATDADLPAFFDAVALARETFTVRAPRRRTRERVPLYADAAQQMDYAVRNTRVLARRALTAIRRHGPGAEPLPCGCCPVGGPSERIAARTFASEIPSALASAAVGSWRVDDEPDDGWLGRVACMAFCNALVETPSLAARALRSGCPAAAGAFAFAAEADPLWSFAAPQPAAAPTSAVAPTITASLRIRGFIMVLLAVVG
jgi:uncharacterized membrane protein YgaE (UPF0421/DUF939 family)